LKGSEKQMKTKLEYIEHLEMKLNEYGGQIELLSAKLDQLKETSKMQHPPELVALITKYTATREKIQTLEKTSAEEWRADIEVAETAWNAMSYGKVIKNF
jgi:predicted RNase H-like nuclease (RuvC/YqgF family)